MTELDVDGIRFTFDDNWSAVKWDDTEAYNLHIGKLQGPGHGTKAVDIIGLRGGLPFLFEVKNTFAITFFASHGHLSARAMMSASSASTFAHTMRIVSTTALSSAG